MSQDRTRVRDLSAGAVLLLCLVFLAGCQPDSPSTPPSAAAAASPSAAALPGSIGVATMKPDGTLELRLVATHTDGSTGEGFFTYPPDHAEYKEVLDHLGGMKPGESKPVPPWP